MPLLEPLDRLGKQLARLPGVGRRSAERMALGLVRDAEKLLPELIQSLETVVRTVCLCERCGAVTLREQNPCRLCTDPRRDDGLLCVVEEPGDIDTLEKSGGYRGRYHALMGKLSPMKGEGIPQLRVESLLRRVKAGGIREVVLALNSDVESDATAAYLRDAMRGSDVKVTRLAYGLPAGSGIAYSDSVTLARALQGRSDVV